MKVYQVGGSVRDALLGLPVKDRDFVVVGATPDEMLAQGFKPVGRDFPVFLHPETREEYALARTERKSGRGHQGFVFHSAPDVTLADDLTRRDLTINAMARDADGTLIDPHGGRGDLVAKVLRHVGPAFGEDPLRVLRVARFAARFEFDVADETLALMRGLVERGELLDLSPERVWQELTRGLVEAKPSLMLSVLRSSGALRDVAPELDALYARAAQGEQPDLGVLVAAALDCGATRGATLPTQFATLCRYLAPEAAKSLAERLRASAECRDSALVAVRHAASLERACELSAEAWLGVLVGVDAVRRKERLSTLVGVVASYGCAAGHPPEWAERIDTQAKGALASIVALDLSGLANEPGDVGARVRLARLGALERFLERGT